MGSEWKSGSIEKILFPSFVFGWECGKVEGLKIFFFG